MARRFKLLTLLPCKSHNKSINMELGNKFFSKNTENIIDTRTAREKLIQKKIQEYLMWYEDFTGLSEVKMCQDRVIKAQEKLVNIQDKRRQTNNELMNIAKKRNELQDQLLKVNKGDPNYLSLVHQEHEVIYTEKNIKSQLESDEREERDCFSYLSNTIRDSHEKQRLQADRTKYWAIFFTIIGPFITYLLTLRKDNRMVHNMLTNLSKDTTSTNLHPIFEKIDEKYLEINGTLSSILVSTSKLVEMVKRTDKNIDKNKDQFNSLFVKMNSLEKKLGKRSERLIEGQQIDEDIKGLWTYIPTSTWHVVAVTSYSKSKLADKLNELNNFDIFFKIISGHIEIYTE